MEAMKKLTVLAALATLVVMAMLMTACDSSSDEGAAVETSEDSDLYTSLSSELELSAEQSSRLRGMLAQQNRIDPEPGFLWVLADSLHSTLNDRQIQRLLNHEFNGNGRFARERQTSGRRANRAGWFRHDGPADGAFPLKQIDLTDDQEDTIQQIREASRDQIEELIERRRSGSIGAENFHFAMAEIREAAREKIAGVLTEDQKAQLKSLREERRTERKQLREEANVVRNRVLGLTDAQATSFDATVLRLVESVRALREQVRSGELTRAQARDQVRANREAAGDELEALLTEDQYKVVQIRRALRFRPALGHRWFRGEAGS